MSLLEQRDALEFLPDAAFVDPDDDVHTIWVRRDFHSLVAIVVAVSFVLYLAVCLVTYLSCRRRQPKSVLLPVPDDSSSGTQAVIVTINSDRKGAPRVIDVTATFYSDALTYQVHLPTGSNTFRNRNDTCFLLRLPDELCDVTEFSFDLTTGTEHCKWYVRHIYLQSLTQGWRLCFPYNTTVVLNCHQTTNILLTNPVTKTSRSVVDRISLAIREYHIWGSIFGRRRQLACVTSTVVVSFIAVYVWCLMACLMIVMVNIIGPDVELYSIEPRTVEIVIAAALVLTIVCWILETMLRNVRANTFALNLDWDVEIETDETARLLGGDKKQGKDASGAPINPDGGGLVPNSFRIEGQTKPKRSAFQCAKSLFCGKKPKQEAICRMSITPSPNLPEFGQSLDPSAIRPTPFHPPPCPVHSPKRSFFGLCKKKPPQSDWLPMVPVTISTQGQISFPPNSMITSSGGNPANNSASPEQYKPMQRATRSFIGPTGKTPSSALTPSYLSDPIGGAANTFQGQAVLPRFPANTTSTYTLSPSPAKRSFYSGEGFGTLGYTPRQSNLIPMRKEPEVIPMQGIGGKVPFFLSGDGVFAHGVAPKVKFVVNDLMSSLERTGGNLTGTVKPNFTIEKENDKDLTKSKSNIDDKKEKSTD